MITINKFKKNVNEKGATAIEYGILAALIGVSLMNNLPLVSGKLSNVFCNISNSFDKESCSGSVISGNTNGSSATSQSSNTNSTTSKSSNDTDSNNNSSVYDGKYSEDVNSFLDNLKSNEDNYIDAWKTTQNLENIINAKRNLGDQNGANELVNTQLGPLKQSESEAYEFLHNGEGNSPGLTQGLNKIFSQDWNNDLSSSGNEQSVKDFEKIKALSFTSANGKTYTLGGLWPDQGSTYMNELTGSNGMYPRH